MWLNLFSGVAVVGLMEWLLITAWLSTSRTAWQYNFWAIVVVALWAQPWSSRDRYRTGRAMIRWMVYMVLLLGTFASAFVFKSLGPLSVTLAILLLGAIEFMGRREVRS
jgi:hypothetical protein